jgi:hypothetical protein
VPLPDDCRSVDEDAVLCEMGAKDDGQRRAMAADIVQHREV